MAKSFTIMINRTGKYTLLLVLAIMTAACTTTAGDKKSGGEECEPPEREVQPGELDVIICESPRPKACTREYDPVCATHIDGATKTYATGCTSCADRAVRSYTKGACDRS